MSEKTSAVVPIMVFPRGQLTRADRKRIEALGVTVVEADDPRLVVQVIPLASVAGGDEFVAAMIEAITTTNYGGETRTAFGNALMSRIAKRMKDAEGDRK